MRRAQVVVYEADSRLADGLREAAQKQGWWLREVRQPDGAIGLLQSGGFGVLVIKLGRDLERELSLLEKITWQLPDVATVVVGDAANASLEDLAWDLGARLVLFPPLPRHGLAEVVSGLLGGGPSTGPAAESAN
jgi:hypothetical protein